MSVFRLSLALFAIISLIFVLPADAQTTFTLKIASVAPEGTPWSDGLALYKTHVESATAGRVKVRNFLGGVLGDENETVSSTKRGQIQGVGASTGALASVVPELAVLELPFLFRSEAEADYVLDKAVLPTIEKAFRDRGLVLGFWSENGYRSFGTTWGAVRSPADLRGKKMRSQESRLHLEMYKAFGASPVPIPTTEVLTSLQTGVVDGYDNTVLYAQAAQWTSATKYFTLTNHIYQPAAIVFNKAWFDTLSPADQQALLAVRTNGLVTRMRREIRALNPLLIQNLDDIGIQVYRPTAAEIAAFQGPAQTARKTYLASASAGEKALAAQIDTALAAYRSGQR